MLPFNAKEVARYLLWIAVLAAALGAAFWLVFHLPGHRSVQPRRGATAEIRQPLPAAATLVIPG